MTISTERVRQYATDEFMFAADDVRAMAAELLAVRESQSVPVVVPDSITYLKGPIISNILADNDNSPMACAARILVREVNFWRSQPLFTAPPAPAVPDVAAVYAMLSERAKLRTSEENISDVLDACHAAMLQPVSEPCKLPDDTRRMDWLVAHHVEVRKPLLYGSEKFFTAQTLTDEEDDYHATSLREQIDAAMAAAPTPTHE